MHLNLAGAAMAAALLLTGAAHAERLTEQPLVDATRLSLPRCWVSHVASIFVM